MPTQIRRRSWLRKSAQYCGIQNLPVRNLAQPFHVPLGLFQVLLESTFQIRVRSGLGHLWHPKGLDNVLALIYLFGNGMAMVFDQCGHQISDYQGLRNGQTPGYEHRPPP